MMRTLQGQGPKIQSVLVDPITLKYDDIKRALPENCSEDSDKWLNVSPARWGSSKAYLDNFFLRPADPEKYVKK